MAQQTTADLNATDLTNTRGYDVDTLERRRQAAHQAADDVHEHLNEYQGDQHLLASGEHLFLTPGGEAVHVTGLGEGRVEVVHLDRTALTSEGDRTLHAYETTATSLLQRMDADGGWLEVPTYVETGTPNCPCCGTFLSVDRDGFDLPAAQCTNLSCERVVDVDELLEQGVLYQTGL